MNTGGRSEVRRHTAWWPDGWWPEGWLPDGCWSQWFILELARNLVEEGRTTAGTIRTPGYGATTTALVGRSAGAPTTFVAATAATVSIQAATASVPGSATTVLRIPMYKTVSKLSYIAFIDFSHKVCTTEYSITCKTLTAQKTLIKNSKKEHLKPSF